MRGKRTSPSKHSSISTRLISGFIAVSDPKDDNVSWKVPWFVYQNEWGGRTLEIAGHRWLEDTKGRVNCEIGSGPGESAVSNYFMRLGEADFTSQRYFELRKRASLLQDALRFSGRKFDTVLAEVRAQTIPF